MRCDACKSRNIGLFRHKEEMKSARSGAVLLVTYSYYYKCCDCNKILEKEVKPLPPPHEPIPRDRRRD